MRTEVLQYLNEIRSHYASYHNHKEVSGWAAVAVFLVFASQFFGPFFRGEIDTCAKKVFVVLVLVALAAVVTWYLKGQFNLRRVGANNVAAAFYLKTDLIGNPTTTITPSDYGLRPASDPKMQYKYVLPRKVLETSDDLENKGAGARKNLEKLAYAFVWVPTLAVACVLWFL